ncbi:transposase [Amycolatopsis lurida]
MVVRSVHLGHFSVHPVAAEHQGPLGCGRVGLPMRFLLTPGQADDSPQLVPLLDGITVARIGPGRPRCRPETVIADKAYSHPSTRRAMRDRRIKFVSPERDDQIARRTAKGRSGGRPPAFDAEAYRQRNVVERCFNRLKQFRDRAAYYQAELTIAAIVFWLHDSQDTP